MSVNPRNRLTTAGLVVLTALAAWPSEGAADQPGSLSAPTLRPISLGLFSVGLGRFTPISEQPIPNGDIWFEFEPEPTSYSNSDGAPQAMALFSPRTSVAEVVKPHGVTVETPLSMGPDGNVLFGGQNRQGEIVIGQLSSSAHLQMTRVPGPIHGDPYEVVGGSDGAIWFSYAAAHDATRLGRLPLTGSATRTVHTFFVASTAQDKLLLPAVDGGFWIGAAIPPRTTLLHVSTTGQVTPTTASLMPSTLDGQGAVWGFDAKGAQDLDRVTANGQETQLTWDPTTEPGAYPETAVLGADGNVWFTAEATEPAPPSANSPTTIDDLIGAAGTNGSVQTWPTPEYTNPEDGPESFVYPFPPLVAAPTGQLYAIGADPQPQNSSDGFTLYAVTLPDAPRMRAATVRVTSAAKSGRRVTLHLSCTGQAGKFCSGTIALRDGGRVVDQQPYALAPGLSATHSLWTNRAVNSATVTSTDPLAHHTQTVRVRL